LEEEDSAATPLPEGKGEKRSSGKKSLNSAKEEKKVVLHTLVQKEAMRKGGRTSRM